MNAREALAAATSVDVVANVVKRAMDRIAFDASIGGHSTDVYLYNDAEKAAGPTIASYLRANGFTVREPGWIDRWVGLSVLRVSW